MRPVSTWFFTVAALCATVGMAWGIQMAATHDHLLSPAHAHLNLVGWVTMGLFGLYYRLTPSAAGRLAWVHFALALAGVTLMVPGIALAILGQTEALAIAGSFATIGSMLLFVLTVLRHGLGTQSP
jgi:cbb3-type cytochrome oxidase subunit 1